MFKLDADLKTSTTLVQIKEHKGFKLVHLNARSLTQHFDELGVTFLDGSLDVVIFTESWLLNKGARLLPI